MNSTTYSVFCKDCFVYIENLLRNYNVDKFNELPKMARMIYSEHAQKLKRMYQVVEDNRYPLVDKMGYSMIKAPEPIDGYFDTTFEPEDYEDQEQALQDDLGPREPMKYDDYINTLKSIWYDPDKEGYTKDTEDENGIAKW